MSPSSSLEVPMLLEQFLGLSHTDLWLENQKTEYLISYSKSWYLKLDCGRRSSNIVYFIFLGQLSSRIDNRLTYKSIWKLFNIIFVRRKMAALLRNMDYDMIKKKLWTMFPTKGGRRILRKINS